MNAVQEAAELESLLAAQPPKAIHGACTVCYPLGKPLPVAVVAICGERFDSSENDWAPLGGGGRHKCAKCLAVMNIGGWPCGHG